MDREYLTLINNMVEGDYTEGMPEGDYIEDGIPEGDYMQEEIGELPAVNKPSLMASSGFIISIIIIVLLISVAIGVVLAKGKIKKGIDLYED